MQDSVRLSQIRQSERDSHIAMYSDSQLYKEGSWLRKPIKTVMELFPYFDSQADLRILDLGCGVGRNCISIAQHFAACKIDCVDILDLAIQKLQEYADEYHVLHKLNTIVASIDAFTIPENCYDWILAISALEHVDSKVSFLNKLSEIRNGTRQNGIVCLVINSCVKELDKATNHPVMPQFEVNLPTNELQDLLEITFSGWKVIKSTVREQCYDIPRESGLHLLQTSVVTFVAMKK